MPAARPAARRPGLAGLLAFVEADAGLAYLLEPGVRFSGPNYAAVRSVLPMWAWGVLLLLAAGSVAAVWVQWPRHLAPVLYANAAPAAVIAVCFGVTPAAQQDASGVAGLLWGFVAATSAITARSSMDRRGTT